MKGAELKALRAGAGIKSKDLARALGLHPASLSRYENSEDSVPKAVELGARYLCEPLRLAQITPAERLVDALREALNEANDKPMETG